MARSLLLYPHTLVYVLLVVASDGHDENVKSADMMLCHRTLHSSLFETSQGNPVLSKQVNCEIKNEYSRAQYHFDVAAVVEPRVQNDTLLYLTVHVKCCSPIEIVFNNSHNLENKYTMLNLNIAGPCIVSINNLALWSSVTDFHEVGFEAGINGRGLNLIKENVSLEKHIQTLRGLAALSFDNISTRVILDTKRKNEWPRMAEITLLNLSLEKIPEELQITMPALQTLDLRFNKLNRPPIFPWSNATLELPRGLRRTRAFNSKINALEGIDVDRDIYLRILRLDANNIEDLSLHEFHGYLHKLSLARNGLRKVGATCFRNLSGIQAIDLSKNNLRKLPPQLFHGLNSLTEIRLRENNISVVPTEIFKGLENIRKITLEHNKIKRITNGSFNSSERLEVVHLEGNKIETIEEGAFSNDSTLREIYLQNNNLTYFPIVVFRLRNVSKIDLSFNALTFQDLVNLVGSLREELDTANFSFEDTQPKLLNLSNNKFTTLDIEGLSENSKQKISRFLEIYEVKLEGNPLTCDCSILAIKRKIEFFSKNSPGLKTRFKTWKCAWPKELKDKTILEINANDIIKRNQPRYCPVKCSCFERCLDHTVGVNCQGRNLTKIPRTLPRGASIELNLRNNNIRDIPVHPYLKNLLALYLTHNKIQHLDAMTVGNLKSIRILHVDSNNLTLLPRNMENLRLTNLALHGNDFKCHCTTKWMKNWLQKLNHNRQIEQVENVLCKSDSSTEKKVIYTLPDERFGCNGTVERSTTKTIIHEGTSTVIAGTVLGSLLAISIIISILVHVYRRVLKAFLYTHFKLRPNESKTDSDSTKIYDAFVSYSEKDRHWVVNTLQERLEKRHPTFKLCIHHRDFEVGTPIVKNILNSVERSKRMLMVLSHSFLQSQWCMLEFRTAHHKVLEDRLKLIIILFDDINMNELDGEMKL